jgi:hypothetical protein
LGALAELESRGGVHQLITQNVDDLHQEAGSRAVVQLHGRNRVVVCLDCRAEFSRGDQGGGSTAVAFENTTRDFEVVWIDRRIRSAYRSSMTVISGVIPSRHGSSQ